MSVALEILRIFKVKGTVEMCKKYSSIYREDIDKTVTLTLTITPCVVSDTGLEPVTSTMS